jgi:predicted nicotinamide N-methyase
LAEIEFTRTPLPIQTCCRIGRDGKVHGMSGGTSIESAPMARRRCDRTARLRWKLMDRVGRRYRLLTAPICLGDLELTFTRIAEPDAVLNDAVLQERRLSASGAPEPAHMPYWASLWESGVALGRAIVRGLDGGASVLDLGCGMGLAGAAAAAKGGRVLMADLEPMALLLACLNTLPWRRRVRARQVNWQTDRLDERFDLILGADILYETWQWEYLHSFWRAHLAAGGRVLLAEPGRGGGDGLAAWASQRGWSVEQFSQPLPPSHQCVRIFRLRRP